MPNKVSPLLIPPQKLIAASAMAAGNGLTPGAATLWGLFPIAQGTDQWIYIAEIEFLTSSGGSNVAAYASKSAGWDGNNATDGNTATDGRYILVKTRVPYIAMSSPWVVATHVKITAPATIGSTCPRAFVVGKSLDGGTTWEYSDIIGPVAAWTNGQVQTFAIPSFSPSITSANAKMWGITSGSTGNVMGDIEFRATAGGANLITGGAPGWDDNTNGGVSGALIFDNNQGTGWLGPAGMSAWYVFPSGFAKPAYVRVLATGYPGFAGSGTMRDWSLWWSKDAGVTKNIVYTCADASAFADYEARLYTIP